MPTQSNNNNNSFQELLEGWLVRQEHLLDELVTAEMNYQERNEDELRGLIARVLSHYQQYYEAKAVAAHNDVFLVLSPTWFSSLERSFLWLGGFKPALAFRLAENSVQDLSMEQLEMLERLKGDTKGEEKELEEQMARVQESVAAPPLLELARRMGRLVDGERNRMESVIEGLRNSMEVLVQRADFLRANTTEKVIEILSPVQGVRLLAAAAQLQLRIRNWGSQRDSNNNP